MLGIQLILQLNAYKLTWHPKWSYHINTFYVIMMTC